MERYCFSATTRTAQAQGVLERFTSSAGDPVWRASLGSQTVEAPTSTEAVDGVLAKMGLGPSISLVLREYQEPIRSLREIVLAMRGTGSWSAAPSPFAGGHWREAKRE
jgi:hypothetical protein